MKIKFSFWYILIFIGLINPMIFISRSPLLFITKRIPISPLPLVFDAPKNVLYSAYQYTLEYTTSSGTSSVYLSKHFMDYYPRNFMLVSTKIIPITSLIINPQEEGINLYLNEILCNEVLQMYGYIPVTEKIFKITLKVQNQYLEEVLAKEYLCL